MSHAHDPFELPQRRIEAVSGGLRGGIIALLAIGAIGLVAAFAVDDARAWRAYYFNWLFFMALAQGGFMLAVVTSIAKGLWSRPIRRIALAHAAFLPIAFIAVLPILFGGAAHHIWPWVEHPPVGKDVWLNLPFLRARTLFGLAVLQGISLWFTYTALRPDMGTMRDRVPPRLHGFYGRFTRHWRGQEAEELHAHRRLSVLAPATALIYALIMGMIAWDFIMSLEPDWFSTLIGPFFFMGAFLCGLMATALISMALRSRLGLWDWILPSTMHDLGKMSFGFTVFWAYLFFSQFIVIWYGLLPHEQEFVIHRFTPPFGTIAQIVGLMVFVLPFFGLISVAAKRTPAVYATFAIISLTGMWLERWLLTFPSWYVGAESLPLSWMDPVMLILFAGLYLLAIAAFLTRVPLFQLWQPVTEIELAGIELEDSERRHLAGERQ